MKINLQKQAVDQAEKLINAGQVSGHDANWENEMPTIDETEYYIETHYMTEYGKWFLGVDTTAPKEFKEHYVYPYGDLKVVQRSALVDSHKKAEKAGHSEIAKEAKRLLELFDKKNKK